MTAAAAIATATLTRCSAITDGDEFARQSVSFHLPRPTWLTPMTLLTISLRDEELAHDRVERSGVLQVALVPEPREHTQLRTGDQGVQAPGLVVPEQSFSWYFCAASNAYYPYVQDCPGGWQAVAPQTSQ